MRLAMRRLSAVLCLLPVLLTVSGAVSTPVKGEASRFLAVGPGIEHSIFQARPENAEPFSGHAFKIDLDVAEIQLIPAGGHSSRRTVEQIAAPFPAVIAVNASFFDKEGGAMGLAVYRGRHIAAGKRQSWGALVVDDKEARIVPGADIHDPLAYRLIVQGIPRLVVGGKVQPLKPQVAERTAVCAGGMSLSSSFQRRPKLQPSRASLPTRLTRAGSGAWTPSTSTGALRHNLW